MSALTKVAYANFWPGFSLKHGFIKYLLDCALPEWQECLSQEDADFVLVSVFPHAPAKYPHKTLCFIWENMRPDYRGYRYSISSDFDDYNGRNCRCPLWYAHLAWPGYEMGPTDPRKSHGHEPLVPIPSLLKRNEPYKERPDFCVCVVSSYEPFRMMAAACLDKIAPVHFYGSLTGRSDPRSKYEILSTYQFNICFENSLFPGYYTEKLLHAWAAGTVPIYFADNYSRLDFNQNAFVNRNNYLSHSAFLEAISYIYTNKSSYERMWSEPLLLNEPKIDKIIAFIKQCVNSIVDKEVVL